MCGVINPGSRLLARIASFSIYRQKAWMPVCDYLESASQSHHDVFYGPWHLQVSSFSRDWCNSCSCCENIYHSPSHICGTWLSLWLCLHSMHCSIRSKEFVVKWRQKWLQHWSRHIVTARFEGFLWKTSISYNKSKQQTTPVDRKMIMDLIWLAKLWWLLDRSFLTSVVWTLSTITCPVSLWTLLLSMTQLKEELMTYKSMLMQPRMHSAGLGLYWPSTSIVHLVFSKMKWKKIYRLVIKKLENSCKIRMCDYVLFNFIFSLSAVRE